MTMDTASQSVLRSATSAPASVTPRGERTAGRTVSSGPSSTRPARPKVPEKLSDGLVVPNCAGL